MIDYSVIREDEYELVTDSESEIDDIEVYYSYDLNVNYYDDNFIDSGDSDYDMPTFLVCMNSFTLLDYSQQAQQYQEKAKEALDEGDISKYTFFMIESKKFAAKITLINWEFALNGIRAKFERSICWIEEHRSSLSQQIGMLDHTL